MSKRAKLRVVDLGYGAKFYEVDCKYSTTSLTYIPSVVTVAEGVLINGAAAEHESHCGRCDVEPVYAKGDPELRRRAERLWTEQVMAGWRN